MSEAARHERRRLLWSHVAVLAAVAAVSQAEGNWISLAVIVGAMATGVALRLSGRVLAVHMRTPLGLLAVVLFMLDFFLYSRGVILTIAHLVVMTAAIYLWTARTLHDWIWFLAQGLVMLSAAGAAAFELGFIVYTLVFAAAAMLFAYHALVGQAAGGPWTVRMSQARRARPRLAAFAAIWLLAMAATAGLLYVLIPRHSAFGFTTPFIGPGQPIAGFSPEVSLGSGIGNILENSAPVFRARVVIDGVVGEAPIILYWRGTTLVFFTGDGWRKTDPEAPYRGRTGTMTLPATIRSTRDRPLGPLVVEQHITMEHLSTDALFVLTGVTRVDSQSVRQISLDRDTGDLMRRRDRVNEQYTFTATSRPAFPDASTLAGTTFDYDPDDTYMALALDTAAVTPEVAMLARQVAGHLPTPYERVAAVRQFLRTQYEYTTWESGEVGGATPVDDFLFRTRRGHCEYFASAMAVMLRAVNVPTRVVNGFIDGEFNPIGAYYTVVQSNAHSWVEVYFVGKGWYTFDPTPEGEVGDEKDKAGYFSGAYDYVKYRWLGAIAGYNVRAQRQIYGRLGEYLAPLAAPVVKVYNGLMRALEDARPGRAGPLKVLVAGGLLLTAAVAGLYLAATVVAWLTNARGLLRRQVIARAGAYPAFYRRFVSLLRKRGFVRRPDETPMEFAMRAAARGAFPEGGAREVVEAYYLARFAGVEPEAGRAARLEKIIETAIGGGR